MLTLPYFLTGVGEDFFISVKWGLLTFPLIRKEMNVNIYKIGGVDWPTLMSVSWLGM